MAETINLTKKITRNTGAGRLRCMDGRREEGRRGTGEILTVVSEGEVEPWIVVRGVHVDAR
jgi:hypothetical protein